MLTLQGVWSGGHRGGPRPPSGNVALSPTPSRRHSQVTPILPRSLHGYTCATRLGQTQKLPAPRLGENFISGLKTHNTVPYTAWL